MKESYTICSCFVENALEDPVSVLQVLWKLLQHDQLRVRITEELVKEYRFQAERDRLGGVKFWVEHLSIYPFSCSDNVPVSKSPGSDISSKERRQFFIELARAKAPKVIVAHKETDYLDCMDSVEKFKIKVIDRDAANNHFQEYSGKVDTNKEVTSTKNSET